MSLADENVWIKRSTMTAIGNSIRAKSGTTELIIPENMPEAIDGITGGGGSDNQQIVVFPETTLPFSDMGNGVYTFQTQGTLDGIAEGNTYTVVWDGTEYSCVCKVLAVGNNDMLYVGNARIIATASGEPDMWEDTGEPFAICGNGTEVVIATASTAATHVIQIYIESQDSSNIDIDMDEEVIPKTTLSFALGENTGVYESYIADMLTDELKDGGIYKVVWDGKEYLCEGKMLTAETNGTTLFVSVCVGNAGIVETAIESAWESEFGEWENNGWDFAIFMNGTGENPIIYTTDTATTHTVQLFYKVQESGGSEVEWEEILPETTLPFSQTSSDTYTFTIPDPSMYPIVEGNNYKVVWDGAEYYLVCKTASVTVGDGTTMTVNYIGNANIAANELEDTGEPFVVFGNSSEAYITTTSTDTTHVVQIYMESESGSAGDSSGLVKYVYFMSEDGSTELYKKPTIDGDDCVDIIAKGLIDKPTKESDVQYDYTYSGYSLTTGGSANSNALKNITEDRVVYVAFKATVRSYTVSYYDSDGTTLLKSESIKYGAIPSYEPVKAGNTFDGWIPEVTAVTGDITYTAKWIEIVTFANGSWEQIAKVCKAGNASKAFKVGDVKNVEWEPIAGAGAITTPFVIIGINHDTLADGGDSISVMSVYSLFVGQLGLSTGFVTKAISWDVCEWRTYFNSSLFESLPSDLQEHIKPALKLSSGTNTNSYALVETEDLVWALSCHEIMGASVSYDTIEGQGNQYEYFEDPTKITMYEQYLKATSNYTAGVVTDEYKSYRTRSSNTHFQTGSSNWGVKADGSPAYGTSVENATPICFCIG